MGSLGVEQLWATPKWEISDKQFSRPHFDQRPEAMTTKTLLTALTVAALAAATTDAAILIIPDHSFVPDGSSTVSEQDTNINALNGGNVLPTGTPKQAYFVTTFTFGTDSDAHLRVNFETAVGGADRIGVRVQDNGFVDTVGTGGPNRSTFNLAQNLAGQTVTLLAKLQYDSTYDTSLGLTPIGANDDTLMNVWVNPTFSSVEGSGISAGDLYALWNSAGFGGFDQTIENQGTLASAGTSFITNTVILTGDDATFANALAFATPVPEPTTIALWSLLGIGLVSYRRWRRR